MASGMDLKEIRKLTNINIIQKEPMSRHTSFKTGGPADYYAVPKNEKELAALVAYCKRKGIEYIIIGNGTNLLVSDRGIRGLVIDLGRNDGTRFTLLGYEYIGEELVIDAGTGCLLGFIGRLAAKLGATGFEQLSGIPGCIGGACIMNAGAYGREMKDVLRRVEAVDRHGRLLDIDAGDIDLRYRGSSLMDEGLIVTRAEIVLMKSDPETVAKGNDLYRRKRQESQPLEYPSAGSTFKRPAGYFAGKLISDAGLKGCTIGGAAVSEKHAGFIINRGGATSEDIYRLIEHCREVVLRRYGVELTPEVRLIGF